MSIVYNAPNTVYYNSDSFLQTNYSKVLSKFCVFKPLHISKCTCSKALVNFNFTPNHYFFECFSPHLACF